MNILLTLILGIMRIHGSIDPIFQAAAHIWVGILIAAIWYTNKRDYWIQLAWLVFVEGIMFGVQHGWFRTLV